MPIVEQNGRIAGLGLLLLMLASGSIPLDEIKENHRISKEMEKSLRHELLDAWYPISLDTVYGGFLSDFGTNWQPDGPQNKMIVTQTRHIWTASQAAMFFNEDRYRRIADHGFRFLKERMWDGTYGGFYTLRNREGNSIQGTDGDYKSAYGNAFGIFSLATYYAMSGEPSALELAQKTFLWLDRHSRDPVYKGYIDRMARDGSWLNKNNAGMSPDDIIQAGWKDQNSSIHLLEAFTELYAVWPDRLLRERLLEMLVLIRDTIANDKGTLTLFLERDWRPVSFRDSSESIRKANFYFDHVSFGHDLETAFLMLEASRILGLESDSRTLTAAKRMVDHALANGWDANKGGFYDGGYYFRNSDSISIINNAKTWWVEAEGLNALLLMARLFPDEKKYRYGFKKQWEYIDRYLIDHDRGGWYKEGLDNSPEDRNGVKGSGWQENYHNARALMNCIKMLKTDHRLMKEQTED